MATKPALITKLDILPEVLSKLEDFRELILKYNKATNLISSKEYKEKAYYQVSDGYLGVQSLLAGFTKENSPVIDLGSGNGIPGMILAICQPELSVALVDREKRKCEFLKLASHRLGLLNVSVYEELSEVSPRFKGALLIARALATLHETCEIVDQASVGIGRICHFKSVKWQEEAKKLASPWKIGKTQGYLALSYGNEETVFTLVETIKGKK